MPIVIRRARVRVSLLAAGDSNPAAMRRNSDGKTLPKGLRGHREQQPEDLGLPRSGTSADGSR
jgi:hypothetical protein